jgi:hypothetical protein
MELKKLDWKTFLIALFFLAFVFFIIVSINNYPWMDRWDTIVYRDQVKKEYGFTLKKVEMFWTPLQMKRNGFEIDYLEPNSKGERIGLKVGDIPVSGYDIPIIAEGFFYRFLCDTTGFPSGYKPWFRVINREEIDDKDWRQKLRKIELDRVRIESFEKKKDKTKSRH